MPIKAKVLHALLLMGKDKLIVFKKNFC